MAEKVDFKGKSDKEILDYITKVSDESAKEFRAAHEIKEMTPEERNLDLILDDEEYNLEMETQEA